MGAIRRVNLDARKIDFRGVVTGKRIVPTPPGDILRDILAELNVTAYRVAKLARVPQNRLSAIIEGKRAVTADTSIRLGRVFGQSDRYWLNLQNAYDVARAEAENDVYDAITPLASTV